MRVQFHKTGERRYSVVVLRDGTEPPRVDSAPGYDPLLPHDMQHFIVEQELGIKWGIFGQVAAGGTARTFHHRHTTPNRRTSRTDRRSMKRGTSLADAGYKDAMRSERATYVCWFNWLSASPKPALKDRAKKMVDTAKSILAAMPNNERNQYSPETIARINTKMESVSRQWAELRVGQYLELTW
ncbi:MAG: hypothetical protein IPP10_13470 [Candidatus Competibacteraceae bacterium]|nr:hypothetical protein [Candidatus Competibacteraceae bacterium]MBK7984740.1 hypothetical protein [Candidatus Competibacteraceae bacterium]MBK9952491.1 hypothetical protein [Candidatus Competibacteraceae bacterium]